jgi:hypothetical protein
LLGFPGIFRRNATGRIIAAQLRHADSGALARRVYIHQLLQTAPRLVGVIEGVFSPSSAGWAGGVGGASGGGDMRETDPRTRPYRTVGSRVSAAQR